MSTRNYVIARPRMMEGQIIVDESNVSPLHRLILSMSHIFTHSTSPCFDREEISLYQVHSIEV